MEAGYIIGERSIMKPFELQIPERKYDCSNCGRCCHIWNVELLPADLKRLAELKWDPADPGPEEYVTPHHGKQVLAHREDGACIFYDADRKGCIIHHRFGYAAKPVGCRLYPFQLATTFSNTVSTTIRFDCPAVSDNSGKPLSKRAKELRGMAEELGLPGSGFDVTDLEGLRPEKCRQIVKALLKHVLLNDDISATDRLIIGQMAVPRLKKLGKTFINEMELSEVLPSFFDRLIQDTTLTKPRRLGAMEQARFLSLLLSFMRRDEEQLGQGLKGRLSRTLALFKLLKGKANLRSFSVEHPDFAMTRAEFFAAPIENRDELDLGILFDMVQHRLESFQFLGQPVYNRSFYYGLQTLFMIGALTVALAKWHAMARTGKKNACRITSDDVADATAAISHAYGRSQLLGLGFMNTMQRQVCDAAAFERIVTELTAGT
jgi:Fe-S-cluster containining protein